MASAKKITRDGAETGTMELSDTVFGAGPNETLVRTVALVLQNNRRQGNTETRTRAEVRGGGRKPYRQKGTGNARHGSTREPQMRGGGTVFGPHKRSYRQTVPVRAKRKALCCVLSGRVREERLLVLDGGLEMSEPKTRPMRELTQAVSPDGKFTLLVTAGVNPQAVKSVRNLPRVQVQTASDLNVLDVLRAGRIVVEQDALAKLEERLS